LGESLGPRRFTFPQSIKNIKPERETFSNYSNKKKSKNIFNFSTFIHKEILLRKKMEFFDRVQPDLNMEKLFTMSHLKRDTRHHLKKVYSALTLTLLAAVGGAVLAKSFPLLANPFLVLGASLYLIFSLGKFIFL